MNKGSRAEIARSGSLESVSAFFDASAYPVDARAVCGPSGVAENEKLSGQDAAGVIAA
jgi:hypothetical protein